MADAEGRIDSSRAEDRGGKGSRRPGKGSERNARVETPESSRSMLNTSLRQQYSARVAGSSDPGNTKIPVLSEEKKHSPSGTRFLLPQSPSSADEKRSASQSRKRHRSGTRKESPSARPREDDDSLLGGNDMSLLEPSTPPDIFFSDLGGIESAKNELLRLIGLPLCHPQIYSHLCSSAVSQMGKLSVSMEEGADDDQKKAPRVGFPRGILLVGPSGTGKTTLSFAVARWLKDLGVTFFRVSAPEIVSGYSGESEAKVRNLFRSAGEASPALIFIDEIDAIAPRRDNVQREMERRIVSQVLTCIDDLSLHSESPVMVLAATNRPHAMDPALRGNGRFEREIQLSVPDLAGRQEVLEILLRNVRKSSEISLRDLAQRTPGFVGSDLQTVVRESVTFAVDRFVSQQWSNRRGGSDGDAVMEMDDSIAGLLRVPSSDLFGPDDLLSLTVGLEDIDRAIKNVLPSVKREGFVAVPSVTWDDVGALVEVRAELNDAIVQHINFPELYARFNVKKSAGVLLYGPPGCGKTLLAKAISNESNANFLSVKGPELLNKYVGESERAVRQVFERARAAAPCIIFFDELDALVPERSGGQGNMVTERVVNQLLTEMDGLSERRDVFVIGATNRSDMIDRALLRPGRFDKLLFVPLPSNVEERALILRAITRDTPLHPDVDLFALGQECAGFSGADLAGLCREAAVCALRRVIGHLHRRCGGDGNNVTIAHHRLMEAVEEQDEIMRSDSGKVMICDFRMALEKCKASVSTEDLQRYEPIINR